MGSSKTSKYLISVSRFLLQLGRITNNVLKKYYYLKRVVSRFQRAEVFILYLL